MSNILEGAAMQLAHRLYTKSSFFIRVKVLQFIRGLQNIIHRAPCLGVGQQEDFPVILAESVSPLYTTDDPAERKLMLGKIENLRQACKKIDKRLLRADQTFSLWRQLGPPWSVRGFVVGREVREGCIVPTIGGGLCQISGALMELAGRLHFKVIERHRHTALPPDVRYVAERDATLFWNYVDLRFIAPFDLLFEAFLTERTLVVRVRAGNEYAAQRLLPVHEINGHLTMPSRLTGKSTRATAPSQHSRTAYLLGEPQTEFSRYVRAHSQRDDLILAPFRHYPGIEQLRSPLAYGLRRSVALRLAVARKQTVAKTHFALAEKLADYYVRRLDFSVEHVCVAQTLLPYLWRSGKLAGRSFDVMMYRAPIATIEHQLNEAAEIYSHSGTLQEFRAPHWFSEAENEALAAARNVITPHAQIASFFDNVIELPWDVNGAATSTEYGGRNIILFPGPTLARKGAYAVRDAIRSTGLPLTITGSQPEGNDFWQALTVDHLETSMIPWSRVHTVVQPALFEYWPRTLLKAHSTGARLLISEGCGIRENRAMGIWHVPFGDSESLAAALMDTQH